MPKLRNLSTMLLGCALAMPGCAADDEESTAVHIDDVPEAGLQPTGFEYNNGLSPTCFWSAGVQKTLRSLGGGAIADAGGLLPKMPDVLPTCYDAIKYAVQCALDNTQSVTNPHTNAVYTGAVGLAKDWSTRKLEPSEKRWVTACMLQRLNALSLSVPILLEGDITNLYENTKQDAAYPFEESTAFGDLFSSTAPLLGLAPAFTAYVCGEAKLTSAVCVDASNLLNLRMCDNVGLLCGVQYIGKCSDKCQANGRYWNCPSYGYSETIRVQTKDNLCL